MSKVQLAATSAMVWMLIGSLPLPAAGGEGGDETPPAGEAAPEVKLWQDTGETLSGTLVPAKGPSRSLTELDVMDLETQERIRQHWDRLLSGKRKKEIPPLRYTVPVDGKAPAPESPPSYLEWRTRAPDDFRVFKNTSPSAAAPSGSSSIVNEPSVVAVGDMVFYTGNWYAALSTDGGDTFSYVNPFTGPYPPRDDGFCCDQVTTYDPGTDTLFYLQQSFPDAANGTHTINVDLGADGTFDCAYYPAPTIFGFGDNTWPDFPDLAVSDNYLYHSANVFSTTTGVFQGAFTTRYPLAQMSTCGALPFTVHRELASFFSFKLTRGATDTMYFADHISNASMRIWRWPDSAAAPTPFDRSVTPWNDATRVCPGPDGRDWCGRIDRRMAAAWVADGVVGFMWVPSQGSGFAYPYTRIARFSTAGLIKLSETLIWNDQAAWAYPSVAVNSLGDLGGTIMAGGGVGLYPSCFAWIADDANGDTFAPLETRVAYFGSSGPAANISGDYSSTQPYYGNDRIWAGACFGLDSTTSGNARYILFGRERNGNLIFADGFESGDTSSW